MVAKTVINVTVHSLRARDIRCYASRNQGRPARATLPENGARYRPSQGSPTEAKARAQPSQASLALSPATQSQRSAASQGGREPGC